MSDPRWTTVDRLLEAALERAPSDRPAFVREACRGNEELRREVESLLAHGTDDFLERPAIELAGAFPTEERTESLVGRQLGAHRIVGLLGCGGMGEVYRAHDSQLGRDVAVKILPRAFHTDPERRARFDREARVLAALNHPHIGGIHGLEDLDGTPALILELVEGDTLAERLARGPMPINEALPIARQIAEALEAAHDKGVVHRDLKPANIKITPQGVVKVLDFGLAKAAGLAEHSPTQLTFAGTEKGVFLGTAAYMSPEQARGQVVDKRGDIWAFGCVLYEMLTGRALFARETVTDTLAALVERDPDWQALPAATPAKIRDLLRRCLQKDPQRRLRDIGDARLDLDDAMQSPRPSADPAGATGGRSIWAWVVAGAMLASVVTAAVLLLLRPPADLPKSDFALTIAPPGASGIVPVSSALATPRISPDGSFLAYFDRSRTLQLRRLNSISPEPLRGLIGVVNAFWSPDSKYLVFAEGDDLKQMRVPDGAPEVIGRVPGGFPTASMSASGALLYTCCQTRDTFSLLLTPKAGDEAKEIRVPGLKEGSYVSGSFLPDSDDVLIGFVPQGSEENEIYLATLRDGNPADPVLLMRNAAGASYTPAGGGRVLFVRNDTLYAHAMNWTARRLEGDPELVQRDVASRGLGAAFSVSRSGIVAWRPGRAALAQVTIFDRQGNPIGTAGPSSNTGALRLSPDEQRVLLAERNGRAWLLEPNQPGRYSLGQGDLSMLWSPDGAGFIVPRSGRVVARAATGSSDGRELAQVADVARLEDVSADGRVVLFRKSTTPDLFSVRLEGTLGDRVPRTVQTGKLVSNVHFSPDERWIVYQVDGPEKEVGVYIQQFPGPALPKQITSSGESPVWGKDGKEIVYLDQDRIWSVRVDTSGGQFRAGAPERMFSVRSMEGGRRVRGITQLAVSRDGSRIYYQQPVEQPDSDLIHIRMGWENEAPRRK